MKILITQPLYLYEKGEQAFNEDFLFPIVDKTNPTERLFMVCDGEGGGKTGETASKLVAMTMARCFASTPQSGPIDQGFLDQALSQTEDALSAYKNAHPESKAIGSTLALLHLGERQVTLAWVGNSQLFYFSQASQTLVLAGSESGSPEAKAMITGSVKRQTFQMKSIPIEDLSPGDYFFLATDGVLEQIDESTLKTLFRPSDQITGEQIVQEIKELSQGFAQDNYSCYLLEVKEVIAPAGVGANGAAAATGAAFSATTKEDSEKAGIYQHLPFIAVSVAILGIIFFAWYFNREKGYPYFMDEAAALATETHYPQAIMMYDSALKYAGTDQERALAMGERGRAEAEMKRQLAGNELGLDQSAEQYKEAGDEFFRLKNYQSALDSYLKALQAKEQLNDQLTEIPLSNLAEAYMQVGNELSEKEVKDCETILSNYQEAFRLYQSPEISDTNMVLLSKATTNAENCRRQLGLSGTGLSSPLASNQTTPQSRSLEPVGDRPELVNSPASSSSNTRPDARVASPASPPTSTSTTKPNARVVSPAETISTRSLDESTKKDMLRRLTSGKNLFADARQTNSAYQYRQSAENLENAAPMLDGAGAYMLAYMYHTGLAGKEDKAKALKYAQKSALQDWASGQFLYAHLLLERKYPRDTITARQSLRQAANQGFLDAVKRLQVIGE